MVKFLPFRGAQLEYANLHCDSECITDKRANTFRSLHLHVKLHDTGRRIFFFLILIMNGLNIVVMCNVSSFRRTACDPLTPVN